MTSDPKAEALERAIGWSMDPCDHEGHDGLRGNCDRCLADLLHSLATAEAERDAMGASLKEEVELRCDAEARAQRLESKLADERAKGEALRQRLDALVTLHEEECPNCPVLLRWRRQDQKRQNAGDNPTDGDEGGR